MQSIIPAPALSRREMLRRTVALSALASIQGPLAAWAAVGDGEGKLIPFLDAQPVGKGLRWENLTSWITPNESLFSVSHYGTPTVDAAKWRLELGGLVKKPATFTLDDIKKLRRKKVTATLECSGNSSSTGFMGAVGNIVWTGTPLAPLLQAAQPYARGIEAVIYGADEKIEKIREKDYLQNFARSLSLADILNRDDIILAYEMNGVPLDTGHGAPLRLIVPGWFGIAWVKWLTHIEILDRRFMGKWMAREYVTIRGEEKDDKTTWRETSVGPMRLKSMCARAVKLSDGTIRLSGAAWNDGTPLRSVEVKVDSGPWFAAKLDRRQQAKYSWTFWSYDWKSPAPGEHTIVSRATDTDDRTQPAADEQPIKLKRTYWEANQQWPRKIKV